MRGDTRVLDAAACAVATAWPRRVIVGSTWLEHVPFGMFLVARLRPATLVELGTHDGDSYCAFCQVVESLGLETRCYAVGTDDGHEIPDELRAHHDALYGGFSRLITDPPEVALSRFADASIDLLHIRNGRGDKDVKHTLLAWLPKMSAEGVVLLHGINAPHGDDDAHHLWSDLSHRLEHFEFLHGGGLGVLAVDKPPEPLVELLRSTGGDAGSIRRLFFALGHRLALASPRPAMALPPSVLERDLTDAREQRDTNAQLLARSLDFVAQLDRERHGHTVEIGRLQQSLAAQDREIADRTRDLDQLRDEVVRVTEDLNARHAELAERTREDEAARHEIARLQHLLATRESDVAERTHEGDVLRRDVAAFQHTLAAQAGELAKRASEGDGLRRDLVDLQQTLARSDVLREETAALKHTVTVQALELSEQAREATSAREAEDARTREEIARLQDGMATRAREIERLQGMVDVVLRSRSWRLTAPLRSLRRRSEPSV